MTLQSQTIQLSQDLLVREFFRLSEGNWRSQRRYYTLKDGHVQEVVSLITVHFLDQGDEALRQLARLHSLTDENALTCGASTSWESNYIGPGAKQTTGSTVFGVAGTQLYRDRGFATSKPIIAQFTMRNPDLMSLRTEYSGNVFEEEIRLIGSQYRTRQTIISRAGEEQMIGQYLETRLE